MHEHATALPIALLMRINAVCVPSLKRFYSGFAETAGACGLFSNQTLKIDCCKEALTFRRRSSRYSSWSSLRCSVMRVPRPMLSPSSREMVNEPPAWDSQMYCAAGRAATGQHGASQRRASGRQ